jgi:outer membrane protein assembly factor BamB
VRTVPTSSSWIAWFRRSQLPVVVALACAVGGPAGAQPTEEESWPMVGRDARHSGASEGPAPPYRRAWTARLEGQGPLKGPVVSEGAVVLVGADSVVALESSSGEVRWDAERDEGPAGAPAIADDLVLYSSGREDAAALVARRLDGGREEWSTPTGAAVAGDVVIKGNQAFAATRDGEVLALDVADGEVRWRFQAAGGIATTPAVADDLVLVTPRNSTTGSSALQAIDVESGEESWRLAPEGAAAPQSSSPAGGSGVAVAGLGDGRIHAVGLASGVERWSLRTRLGFGSGQVPALPEDEVGPDVSGLYFSQALRLSRLDPATGEERWSYQLPNAMVDASPSLTGPYALIGDATGLAAAIDVASGLLVWKGRLGPGPITSFAVTAGRLFVSAGGEDGVVVALEHDPEGTLLREESPTVLDPVRAALNYLGAALALALLLLLLFRGPRLRRSRSEGSS